MSVSDAEFCRMTMQNIEQWDFFCRKKSSVNKHILIYVLNFDFWKNIFCEKNIEIEFISTF